MPFAPSRVLVVPLIKSKIAKEQLTEQRPRPPRPTHFLLCCLQRIENQVWLPPRYNPVTTRQTKRVLQLCNQNP